MPYTYPPAAPTVDSQGIETISRFLNAPALVTRALRTIAQNRFIGDTILSGRASAEGGAVQYEQNESIFPDRVAESIEPGARYPKSTIGFGPSQIAAVKKWGVDAIVTDEAIRRQRMNPVDRALTKLANGVIQKVDTVALAAVAAAVTQTQAATAAWSAGGAKILLDVLTAKATIAALNQGYDPDTVVIDDITFARAMADPTLSAALRRENPDNPVYTGTLPEIAGLVFLPTPNLPVAGTALVLDRKVLGGMADEVPLTGKSIREEDGPTVTEGWVLRALRIVVPFVQEPNAAIKITGV